MSAAVCFNNNRSFKSTGEKGGGNLFPRRRSIGCSVFMAWSRSWHSSVHKERNSLGCLGFLQEIDKQRYITGRAPAGLWGVCNDCVCSLLGLSPGSSAQIIHSPHFEFWCPLHPRRQKYQISLTLKGTWKLQEIELVCSLAQHLRCLLYMWLCCFASK